MPEAKLNKLPLEWVRVFEAAGRTGSFTAAAQETGITQAAVSQRIRNLEQRIGAALFTRQARGVTLTVEGEAWLPFVTQALSDLERSADELFAKPLKRLEIAASASVIQHWIVPRMAALTDGGAPQISLSTMTLEGDFELAGAPLEVRYGLGPGPGRHGRKLFEEALQPLAAPRLMAGVENWQTAPLIALSGPRPGWREWARQTRQPAPAMPQLRFDSLAPALAAAKAGLGVVLGSLPLCREALDANDLVPVCEGVLRPAQSYWLTADEKSVTQRQWQRIAEALCVA